MLVKRSINSHDIWFGPDKNLRNVEERQDELSCDRCGKVKLDYRIHQTLGKTELVKYAHERFIPYTTNLETDDNVWLNVYEFEEYNFKDDKSYTVTSELWLHEDYTGKDLCPECADKFINLLAEFFKEES